MDAITINVIEASETFAVYMHMDADDGIIKYVGVCPIGDALKFDDASCNSLWPSIFRIPGKRVSVAIYSTHNSQPEAHIAQRKLIHDIRPICNVKGYWIAPHRQSVHCNETGEQWNTVREAAAAHNLSISALSNHLNGKAGYRSVKGRTYRRSV